MDQEKEKAVKIIRDGGYVEDITANLGITAHQYYRMRHEDDEFDRMAKEALDERPTPHSKDTDEEMFLTPAGGDEEIQRRCQILRVMRKCSL